MAIRSAFMFPGQGSYLPGSMSDVIDEFPRARTTLDLIDGVCADRGIGPVSGLLLHRDALSLDELVSKQPAELDVALFAAGIATFEILTAIGVRADVMVGHSFGELNALTAAGALGVEDATRVVCSRATALRDKASTNGGMVALGADSRRAHGIVELINDPDLAVAVSNGPEQTVISGTEVALSDVENVAQAAGIRATRLRAAFPFHNRLLDRAAKTLSTELNSLAVSEPSVPVFSPVLGRYVRSAPDVVEWLYLHMVRPVMFYDAVLRVHRDGVRHFVEVGARDTLTHIVQSCLPPGAVTVAPLRRRCTAAEFRAAFAESDLRHDVPVAEPVRTLEPAMAVPTEKPSSVQAVPSATPNSVDRGTVLARLRSMYAEALEYPEAVLTEDAVLEADLGVDSIRQTDLMVRARALFSLGDPNGNVRAADFDTLGKIADYVMATLNGDALVGGGR